MARKCFESVEHFALLNNWNVLRTAAKCQLKFISVRETALKGNKLRFPYKPEARVDVLDIAVQENSLPSDIIVSGIENFIMFSIL
jgi:hypothetical protein